jgi:predicted TIM-barrel fold metal-dependent hydrolase
MLAADAPPLIVSVDDHVVEPPDMFEGRLPSRFADREPNVVRERVRYIGGTKGRDWVPDPDGELCDVWHYDGARMPLTWLLAAVGKDKHELDVEGATYDEVRPGSWKQAERLADMDANHVEASMCFPNLFRFAGQIFSERPDRELALHCIRAYNDWIIDDWGGGPGKGRLLPVTLVPLWDAELAGAEVRRCADKGSYLVAFPENPFPLGFPSLYEPAGYWAPFFSACEETQTLVNMHVGSSSFSGHPTPHAPFIASAAQMHLGSLSSLIDFIFSGTLERHRDLKVSYSEGQVGWLPYSLERADKIWRDRTTEEFGSSLPRPPSEYIPDRVYFCIFDDEVGLRLRDLIGMSQITFETDYPHADSTFPDSRERLDVIRDTAGLSADEVRQLARGNAVRGYGLDRYGLVP